MAEHQPAVGAAEDRNSYAERGRGSRNGAVVDWHQAAAVGWIDKPFRPGPLLRLHTGAGWTEKCRQIFRSRREALLRDSKCLRKYLDGCRSSPPMEPLQACNRFSGNT